MGTVGTQAELPRTKPAHAVAGVIGEIRWGCAGASYVMPLESGRKELLMAVILIVEDGRVHPRICGNDDPRLEVTKRFRPAAWPKRFRSCAPPNASTRFLPISTFRQRCSAGCDLADRAIELRPSLRVLYTTGNTVTEKMKSLFAQGYALPAQAVRGPAAPRLRCRHARGIGLKSRNFARNDGQCPILLQWKSSVSDIAGSDIVETFPARSSFSTETSTSPRANRAFYQTFRTSRAETEGCHIYELGNAQWDIPTLHTLLESVIPHRASVEGFEVEHDFPTIGWRTMLVNARKIFRPGAHDGSILLAIEDVSEQRAAQAESKRTWRLTQSIVDTIRDPWSCSKTT